MVLKVWDFNLPSTSTLKSAFGLGYSGFCQQVYGGYDGCGQYPGGGGSPDRGLAEMHVAQAKFFLDHRVTLSQVVVSPTKPKGDWHDFDSTYGPLLDGKASTQLPGAKLTTIQYANSFHLSADDLRDWVSHFASKGWLPRLFQ